MTQSLRLATLAICSCLERNDHSSYQMTETRFEFQGGGLNTKSAVVYDRPALKLQSSKSVIVNPHPDRADYMILLKPELVSDDPKYADPESHWPELFSEALECYFDKVVLNDVARVEIHTHPVIFWECVMSDYLDTPSGSGAVSSAVGIAARFPVYSCEDPESGMFSGGLHWGEGQLYFARSSLSAYMETTLEICEVVWSQNSPLFRFCVDRVIKREGWRRFDQIVPD